MSFDVNWDIDKYREDHESDEHWTLRRNFMERWKSSYPQDRLICLARVFANMEFMGCRYPQEVMQEVAKMSKEVNKNTTYNHCNANLPYFYDVGRPTAMNPACTESSIPKNPIGTGYSLPNNTTFSTGSSVPNNATVAQGPVSTNPANSSNFPTDVGSNQNPVESEYVWRHYSSEVMQGPVSISKVLQTTHSKSFIRDNLPIQNSAGSTWHKFPRTDAQQPSTLSDFIDKTHLDTENSPTLWCREPKTLSFQESNTAIPQQDGIQSSKWQTNQYLRADPMTLPHLTVGNALIPRDVDLRLGIPYEPSQNQTMTNNENYHNVDTHLGINIGVSEDQTMKNERENSIQVRNTYPNPQELDSLPALSNCNEDPGKLQKPESHLPQKSITTVESKVMNRAIEEKNKNKKSKAKSKKYKKYYKPTQLKGAASRRYKYWLHVGKAPHEARALCEIRFSKIPEYKQIKKKMGSSSSFNSSYLKFAHKNWPGRVPPPQALLAFEKNYVPKLKQINRVNADMNNMGATASTSGAAAYKMGAASCYIGAGASKTGAAACNIGAAASNIGAAPSNGSAVVKDTSATETQVVGSDFSNSGVTPEAAKNTDNINTIGAAVSNIGTAASNTSVAVKNTGATVTTNVASNVCNSSITSDKKNTDNINHNQERLKYWLRMGKTEKEANILSQLSLGDNKQVKQLKARSMETMQKKLAYKEHFKQFIKAKTPPKVNTINTPQSIKNAANKNSDVIEISDDDDKDTMSTVRQKNAAKIKIAKDIEEKRRNWWMQQGKSEEEAAILCQKPMAISDALERIPIQKEILDQERHDKNLPLKPIETSDHHSIPIHQGNIISIMPESETHGNYTETDNANKLRLGENQPLEARDDQRDHHSIPTHQQNTCLTIPAESRGNHIDTDNANKLRLGENLPLEAEDDQRDHHSIPTDQRHTSLTIPAESRGNHNRTDNASKLRLGENASQFQIFVKDANVEIGRKKLTSLKNAISQCISDNKEISMPLISKRHGCVVLTCNDEQSRDWLDKEILTLAPWCGAQLEIIDEIIEEVIDKVIDKIKAPVHVHAWIYIPIVPECGPLLKPVKTLKKLHKQNPRVGCDKWIVLHAQMIGEGQLLFVRFDDKSEQVLKTLGYKLNWYSSRPIRVKLRGKKKPQTTKLVNEQLHQKKLQNKPQNYKNLVKNQPNQETDESSPLIILSEDYLNGTPQVDEEPFSIAASEMHMPMDPRSVMWKEKLLNPLKITSYSEMSPINRYGYPEEQMNPSQPSPLLRNERTASEIDPRISHLKVLTEPSTSTECATQLNKATSSRMDQMKQVSLQLENAHHQEITESRIVSERVSESRILRENRSETGQENRTSTVIYSKTEDIDGFWGIDAPRLLPGHRAGMTLKTDLREYDYSQETVYFKEARAFAGCDEDFSLEERVFAARKQKCSRERVSIGEDQQYSRDNRVYDDRDQGYAQENRFITGRDQENYREVREHGEQAQGYSQNIVVTVRDQENYREVRNISERDQGYPEEDRVVTDRGEDYYRKHRVFDERDQGTSQDRVVTDKDQEYFREARFFDERDQINSQDIVVPERCQEKYFKVRDSPERDRGYSQEDRVFTEREKTRLIEENNFTRQVKNSGEQEYSREHHHFNERGEECSRQHSDFDKRDQEYSRQERDFCEREIENPRERVQGYYEDDKGDKEYSREQSEFDDRGQGYYREHSNFDDRDEEYTHEARRVQGYRDDRFVAGRDDQNSRKGRVFDRREREYRREDLSPSAPSAKSCFRTEERVETRRADSRKHFGRLDERAAYLHCQDSRKPHTSYGTTRGTLERSRGDSALDTMKANFKNKRKSGAYRRAQQQKRSRF